MMYPINLLLVVLLSHHSVGLVEKYIFFTWIDLITNFMCCCHQLVSIQYYCTAQSGYLNSLKEYICVLGGFWFFFCNILVFLLLENFLSHFSIFCSFQLHSFFMVSLTLLLPFFLYLFLYLFLSIHTHIHTYVRT